MNFYKATENPNSDSTKNQHADHRLPGRYALDKAVDNPEIRVLGPGNRLSQHD